MKSVSALKAVESTLTTINGRTPAYVELTERFGPVFISSARLRDELVAEGVASLEIDPVRLAAGVPVLVGSDFSQWTDLLSSSVKRLLPELLEVLELEDDACEALRVFFDDSDTLLALVQARTEGDWKHFENTSVQLETVSATTLLYISEIVFSPVLCAIAETLGERLESHSWEHGHCPVCGSSPSISQLSPKEITDLDQLVGGGGKKYLHCSLCGHDWRYKRNACPSCGNDDSESREVFYADDTRFERVEACHKCGTYCLNVDLRECEPLPHLDAIQMGLIHLDIYAQKKKLTPLVSTLWNSLD